VHQFSIISVLMKLSVQN